MSAADAPTTSGSAAAAGSSSSSTDAPAAATPQVQFVDRGRTVPVKTSDGDTIQVKESLMLQCGIFRQMYNDLNMAEMETTDESFIFPVEIKTEVFNKVVEWCEKHVGVADPVIDEEPLTRERKWFTLTEEEKTFLNVDVEALVDLLTASNFLDLKTLYLFGCQTMASLIKDKTPEQIRELLGLEDDLTEEEKEEIRQNNVWCNY